MRLNLVGYLLGQLGISFVLSSLLLFLIYILLLLIKVIILGDLVDGEAVGAVLCVLEASRLLHYRCLLHLLFSFFIHVRLVVLSNGEQVHIHTAIAAVHGRRRVGVVERASHPAAIGLLVVRRNVLLVDDFVLAGRLLRANRAETLSELLRVLLVALLGVIGRVAEVLRIIELFFITVVVRHNLLVLESVVASPHDRVRRLQSRLARQCRISFLLLHLLFIFSFYFLFDFLFNLSLLLFTLQLFHLFPRLVPFETRLDFRGSSFDLGII